MNRRGFKLASGTARSLGGYNDDSSNQINLRAIFIVSAYKCPLLRLRLMFSRLDLLHPRLHFIGWSKYSKDTLKSEYSSSRPISCRFCSEEVQLSYIPQRFQRSFFFHLVLRVRVFLCPIDQVPQINHLVAAA